MWMAKVAALLEMLVLRGSLAAGFDSCRLPGGNRILAGVCL